MHNNTSRPQTIGAHRWMAVFCRLLTGVVRNTAPCAQVYGQGECPMGTRPCRVSTSRNAITHGWRERLNSVGRAQSPVEVAILGPDGNAPDADTVGEMAVVGQTDPRDMLRAVPVDHKARKPGP